ncbi:unnamed protein product [Phytophthora fragariaefolia]|uniref:Unnamed protein product n=1 Tax=Phytophthora fragariaefolia TaxID=1490495 RepID=A0A9W6UDL4_9STRA|nr:unnamed protein product [Phytophthora fragariaefolia]
MRFNRTLKQGLTKTFPKRISQKLITDVIENYNSTFHRSIGMTPSDAKGKVMDADLSHNQAEADRIEKEFEVGSSVLYRLKKQAFGKESARWSNAVYTIVGIDGYRVQIRSKNGHTLYKAPNDLKLLKQRLQTLLLIEAIFLRRKRSWIIRRHGLGILTKKLIDEYSQTNPEVSTTPEVNVKPMMVDTGVEAKPLVIDVGVSAKPSIVDVGINNTPIMNDAMVGEDAPDNTENYTFSDRDNDEIEEQKRSKQAVAEIFEVYPILAGLGIHPLASNGRQLTKYYIGKDAKTYSIRLNKLVLVPSINWSETYDHIRVVLTNDVRFLNYISERRERNEMGKEDKNTPHKVWEYIGSKRKRVNAPDGDIGDPKSNSFGSLVKNTQLLESNGLRKKIVPILNGTSKSTPIDNDGYVWVDGNSINVYGKESDRTKSAITKRVNWQLTLRSFINMVRAKGLELKIIGNEDKEIDVNDFAPIDGEARHGTMSGIDEDMEEKLSNADNDAKRILTDYYTQLYAKDIEIPFRLIPVVDTKNGVKQHPAYYFGQPTESRALNIMTEDKYKKHKQVSGAAWKAKLREEKKLDEQRRKNLDDNLKVLNDAILKSVYDIKRQSVEEYDHDDNLQKLHDDSETVFQAYGEAQKRYEEAKEAVRGSNSKSARSALKAATAAMRATKAVFQVKAKRYSDASGSGLEGRGLRGAGVAPLEGVVRRGRTYNLNEIQGLATLSAYTYKQLGSKYIRIPDLDAKTLVIVQPNRRKCGPKCPISDSLQAMIKTLVYKNHIDQDAYDKLSIDDKKLFKEILAITHLQYNFHDKLTDPLETLRAEYDKLKGEMELGNDNPSIIKQLKSLTVDMYSNRLIGDNEFKQIITRLL